MIEITTHQVVCWLVDLEEEYAKVSGKGCPNEELATMIKLLDQGELFINKIRQDLELAGTMCVCTEPLPELGKSLKGDEYCSCCGKARS